MKRVIAIIRPVKRGVGFDKPVRFRDAYFPGEEPPPGADGVFDRTTARLIPAHTTKGAPMDMRTMKLGRERTMRWPDAIHVGNYGFNLSRGSCDEVRYGHPAALDEVALIDSALDSLREQKAKLEAQRRLALEDAWMRGKRVHAADFPEKEPR